MCGTRVDGRGRGRGDGDGGGRGGASRLRRRPHFPRAAAAVVRSGLPPPCCVSFLRARCCCRRRAREVRVPRRSGPRAFSHWRKAAAAGGLARDWLVARRPRTWHLIGRAGSGPGGEEGIGGCRDARVSGSGGRVVTPYGAGVGWRLGRAQRP